MCTTPATGRRTPSLSSPCSVAHRLVPMTRLATRLIDRTERSADGRQHCRHIDGTWRSADEVPRTPQGRPRAFVAVNGHGSYPYPGRIIRLFGVFNDNTSDAGARLLSELHVPLH